MSNVDLNQFLGVLRFALERDGAGREVRVDAAVMLAVIEERERLHAENESLRQQIDPESIQHWDTMRAQRDKAQAEVVSLLNHEPDPDWLIWSCKVAAPREVVGPLEPGSDAPMRRAVREAFARVTGVDDFACFSGWNGSFTPGEREVVEPDLRKALEAK